jgi:hypothetical protein
MTLISPSLVQARSMTFDNNFYRIATQGVSKLNGKGIVQYKAGDGKNHNISRIGALELVEVTGIRQPDKQIVDFDVDNRQLTIRRYTATAVLDALEDIDKLIADPTSDIRQSLLEASNRVMDAVIIDAATGSILTGAPNAALTATSAASDGVITVDATSGFTYDTLKIIQRNFTNNNVDVAGGNVFLAITGNEALNLQGEEELINMNYGNKSAHAIPMSNYDYITFAGSVTGTSVTKPILPETTTTRTCIAFTPNSIAGKMLLNVVNVDKAATKVNAKEVTIEVQLGFARMEGKRLQFITTTI